MILVDHFDGYGSSYFILVMHGTLHVGLVVYMVVYLDG
jgi:hypothetical protein